MPWVCQDRRGHNTSRSSRYNQCWALSWFWRWRWQNTQKNKENCKKWKDRSITNDGTVVVPISISNKKHVKWKRATIRGRGGSRFFPSRVLLADYFPIEPGFSITIHKAQVCVCILYIIKIQICPIWLQWIYYKFFFKGRTIQKVILSISEHPFQFTCLRWEGL